MQETCNFKAALAVVRRLFTRGEICACRGEPVTFGITQACQCLVAMRSFPVSRYASQVRNCSLGLGRGYSKRSMWTSFFGFHLIFGRPISFWNNGAFRPLRLSACEVSNLESRNLHEWSWIVGSVVRIRGLRLGKGEAQKNACSCHFNDWGSCRLTFSNIPPCSIFYGAFIWW